MNSHETILTIIILIIIGYLCRRLGFLKAKDAPILNKIVINLAIPSLIFLSLYTEDLTSISSISVITLLSVLIGIMCSFLAYIFSRIQNLQSRTKWSVIVTSSMYNSGFLGYPVVLGVFGSAGLVRAIFFDLGNTILFVIFGIILILHFGGSYKNVTRRAILFPPLWGVILGVTFNLLKIPLGFIPYSVIDYLSGAAIPLIMISLGITLEFQEVKNYLGLASFVSLMRIVISPLIAFILITALGWSGLNSSVTILEAAMPSAMLALVLAITYDLDVHAATAAIFLSTTLSLISLTFLAFIL